jgi:hypothetical protein
VVTKMRSESMLLAAFYVVLCLAIHASGFVLPSSISIGCSAPPPPSAPQPTTPTTPTTARPHRPGGGLRPLVLLAADDDDDTTPPPESISVTINTTLSDANTRRLFAWIKCAFDYDESDENDVYAYYYNNIELAIAAAFGDNLPKESLPGKLLEMAMKKEGLMGGGDDDRRGGGTSNGGGREWEERLVGDPIGRRDRESASLGAMGAAQWSGRWMTRPHCKFVRVYEPSIALSFKAARV